MAWLGEGFSTLKDQITNFTKEVKDVLTEGKEDDDSEVRPVAVTDVSHEPDASVNLQHVPTNTWASSWEQAEWKPVSNSPEQHLIDKVTRLENDKRVLKEVCRDLEGQVSELSHELYVCKKGLPRRLAPDGRDSSVTKENDAEDELTAAKRRIHDLEVLLGEARLQVVDNHNSESSRYDHEKKIDEGQVLVPNSALSQVCSERDKLKEDNRSLVSELQMMAATIQDLEANMTKLLEDNATLANSLEELDSQHQEVIDQLIGAKKSLLKENETLAFELAELKSHMSEAKSYTDTSVCIPSSTTTPGETKHSIDSSICTPATTLGETKSCTDISVCTNSTTTSGEESNSHYDGASEEEILENHLQVKLDLPQELIKEQTANLKYESLMESLTEVPDDNGIKTCASEDNNREIMKKLHCTQIALKERDEVIGDLRKKLSTLKESEEILITELKRARSNSVECLSSIPENSEEVEALEQRVTMLEEELRDYNLLKTEIDRLKEERSIIARQVHFAEASLNNEENYQRTTGHELQQALEANNDFKRENDVLLEKINRLKIIEEKYENLKGMYYDLKDCLDIKEEELEKALNKNASLVTNLSLKENRVQEVLCSNKELADQNSVHTTTIKSQSDLINGYKNIEAEYLILQKSIATKDEETCKTQEKNCCLQSELNVLSERLKETVHAKGEVETKHDILINQLEDQKVVFANKDLELTELSRQLSKAQSELDETLNHNSTLKSDILTLTQKMNSYDEEKFTRDQQIEEIIQTKSKLDLENEEFKERCSHLENDQLSLKNEISDLVSKNTELFEKISSLSKQNDELTLSLEAGSDNKRWEDLESLQHEAEKWKTMVLTSEHHLNEALQARAELEAECKRLSDIEGKVRGEEHLQKEVSRLASITESVEKKLAETLDANEHLKQTSKCLQEELDDKQRLEEELSELKSLYSSHEYELQNVICKNVKLDEECQRLVIELTKMESVKNEASHWKGMLDVLQEQFDNLSAAKSNLEEQLVLLIQKTTEHCTDTGGEEKNDEVKKEQADPILTEYNQLLCELDRTIQENDSLKAENQSLKANKPDEDNVQILHNPDLETSDVSHMTKETVKHLSEIIICRDEENRKLAEKCSSLDKLLTELEDSSSKKVSHLQMEKDELIRTVQIKHQENVNYHNEIQRLNGVVSQEWGLTQQIRSQYEQKSKDLHNTQNELIAVKQRLDNLECPTNELKDQVVCLTSNTTDETSTQKLGVVSPADQPSSFEELQAEHSKLLNQLQKESSRNIYLQNEVQEQHEKESSLLRELERLRLHLVAVEESYTHEAVARENEMSDVQGKLAAAEERIKISNNALTSASVRANQHVETLQGQARLIGQQRDDVQAKLSAAEDQIQRHAAALINLQAVLEQFQRDKDDEVASAKIPLERKLATVEEKMREQSLEMSTLQSQLMEARHGLDAAARLGQQLDEKSRTIAELMEDVSRLTRLLQTAEKREENASSSAEGRVDKLLLKNLVLGYLSAPNNTRPTALRILGTVLDFNHEERGRAGLELSPSNTGGWLHKLLHPGPETDEKESLSESFIRFLESESRPQPQLKLLPTIPEQELARSSESPVPVGRSPILLTDMQLPTFTQFPVSRSSSSILKDVLNNS